MSKDSLVKYHQYNKERQKKACERLNMVMSDTQINRT